MMILMLMVVAVGLMWGNPAIMGEDGLNSKMARGGDRLQMGRPVYLNPSLKDIPKSAAKGWVWLLFEDFEDGAIPPGWSVDDGNGDGYTWEVVDAASWHSDAMPPNPGNYVVAYDDDAVGGSPATEEKLIMPVVDVTEVSDLYLLYGIGYQEYWGSDTFIVRARAFSGGAWGVWMDLVRYGDDLGSDVWDTVNLKLLFPCDSIQVAFVWRDMNDDHWDWYVALDNIGIGYPVQGVVDVAVTEILSPLLYVGNGESVTPSCRVVNTGKEDISDDITVVFEIYPFGDTSLVYSDTSVIAGGLASGDTADVTFDSWIADPSGYYVDVAYHTFVDAIPSNDTVAALFSVNCPDLGTCGPFTHGVWLADLAYNPNTGHMFAVAVGEDNGIVEFNPNNCMEANYITPDWGTSQRGIAYDPDEDVLYVGGWNEGVIYTLDPYSGEILNSFSAPPGLENISGLAFDNTCKVLWIMTNSNPDMIGAIDPHTGELLYGPNEVGWVFPDTYIGAGLAWAPPGYLLAVNQGAQTMVVLDKDGVVHGWCPITGAITYGWGVGIDWEENVAYVTDPLGDDPFTMVKFEIPSFEPFSWECPCPPPFVYLVEEFNFNESDGGFTSGSPNPGCTNDWEWGPYDGQEPPYGCDSIPITNYWGTVIGGFYSPNSGSRLMSPPIAVQNGYWMEICHYYNIESYFDGGNVKISTDGGDTFTILTPFDGYPEDGVSSGNCFIPGEPAFSGTYVAWRKDYFDLSDYAGDTVIIAFDFGSDNSVTYAGWYINWVKIWSTVPVEVGEKEQILPGKVALHEAVPNPTTGITSISFSLPRSMEVDLSVYDATGRLVRNLISGEVKAGTHTVTWNGRDGYYRKVPNGVYFLRLRAGSATESRKLLLIR